MEIRMKLIHELGTFVSENMEIPDDEYNNFIKNSKNFWILGEENCSFDLLMDNGAAIFPPEILNKSILVIEKINEL